MFLDTVRFFRAARLMWLRHSEDTGRLAVRETVAILFQGMFALKKMFAVKGIISVLSTSFSSETFTHPEHEQEKSGTNLARHQLSHKSFFARDKLSVTTAMF